MHSRYLLPKICALSRGASSLESVFWERDCYIPSYLCLEWRPRSIGPPRSLAQPVDCTTAGLRLHCLPCTWSVHPSTSRTNPHVPPHFWTAGDKQKTCYCYIHFLKEVHIGPLIGCFANYFDLIWIPCVITWLKWGLRFVSCIKYNYNNITTKLLMALSCALLVCSHVVFENFLLQYEVLLE